jgi:hypothetical protein
MSKYHIIIASRESSVYFQFNAPNDIIKGARSTQHTFSVNVLPRRCLQCCIVKCDRSLQLVFERRGHDEPRFFRNLGSTTQHVYLLLVAQASLAAKLSMCRNTGTQLE